MTGASLQGRCALVTGASNGIGAATAQMLAQAGARVMIGYYSSAERAEKLRASLPGNGHCIQRIALEDAASVRAAAQAAHTAFGRLDVLVNSAGFTRPIAHANLDALDNDFMDAMLIANVRGPFSMIRACAPLMKQTGDAVIVNISSISGFTGSGSNIAYCASKAAIDNISLALARVLGPEIRVMCVSPGAVATDFVAGRGRPELEKIAAGSPLKKVVEPEDVAQAVMACVTHLKSSTGGRIIVDGGRFLV
ncbi:MAG: SDR family oxidoreductase [Alphaproteobacteria bacterium]|nr:SDR family oxidoreductase [Alphaproteobacteria bacterium]